MAVTYQVTTAGGAVLVFCLSSDTKPTATNDTWILWETDTGNRFRWNGSSWVATTGTYAGLSGVPSTFAPSAHTHPQSEVTNLVTDLSNKQATSEKGQINGYASLDGTGLVPVAQLPGLPAAWGAITGTISTQTDLQSALDAKAPTASPAFTGTPTGITKSHVGLGNVDNTADSAKPVSTAQQTALDAKQDALVSGTNIKTINGSSVLGSGNLVVTGAAPWTFFGALANDVSTGANVTPVNVTGLVFTYEANSTYLIEVVGSIQNAAATTGIGLQFDLSSAVTFIGFTFRHQLANTGTLSGGSSIADDASVGVSSGNPANNQRVPISGMGTLVTTGNTGTAQLRLRSEVAAVSTIKAGTILRVTKI